MTSVQMPMQPARLLEETEHVPQPSGELNHA